MVGGFFSVSDVEAKMDKHHQESTYQYDLPQGEGFNEVCNICYGQNRADYKIQQGDSDYNMIKPAVKSVLYIVCIKQKGNRSKEDHNKAQGSQGR